MVYIKSAIRILLYLIIYYVFQLIFFMILGADAILKGLSNSELQSYVYKNSGSMMILSMIISLIIYFFMVRNNENNVFRKNKFKNIGIKNTISIIFICIAFSMMLSGIAEYVIKYFPSYNETSKIIDMSMNSIFGILAVLICAPIFEEILFRGMILGEIKERVNIGAAIIIQGILFGIYHMNLFQSIYAAVLGILLGFICVKTGSIIGSIIAHIIFNICGSVVFPYLVDISGKFAFLYIIAGTIILIISMYKFNGHNILDKYSI